MLGRRPDYDTSHDTLVRVLVSQLRKKLHEHFAGEGHDEPVIIEIPKGSYVPVFRPRPEEFPGIEAVLLKPAFAARPLLADVVFDPAHHGVGQPKLLSLQHLPFLPPCPVAFFNVRRTGQV